MTDEETVYYTDSYPPASFESLTANSDEVLKTAIHGCDANTCTDAENASPPLDRMQYGLYEDTATWEAWSAWAEQNAYNPNQVGRFEGGTAIQLVGNWPSIATAEKSFMCIVDKSDSDAKGGVCGEANVTDSTYEVKTWRLTNDDVGTKLDTVFDAGTAALCAIGDDTYTSGTACANKDFGFAATTNGCTDTCDSTPVAIDTDAGIWALSDPALTEVTEDANPDGDNAVAITDFRATGFDVLSCTLTSIQMVCNNWVRASENYTPFTDRDTVADTAVTTAEDGYPIWKDAQKVRFYWWDGRDQSLVEESDDVTNSWGFSWVFKGTTSLLQQSGDTPADI